jgi:hypothetical protein
MGKAPCLSSCLLARTFQVRQFLREVLVLLMYIMKGTRPGKNPLKIFSYPSSSPSFLRKKVAFIKSKVLKKKTAGQVSKG